MIDFSLSWNNILQNREIPFADLPDQGPVISGSQPRYHTGDILAANCSSSRSLPAASLKWANSTLTQIWLQIFFSPWHWININPEAYKVRWLEDFFPSNCFAVKLHQPSLAAQLWLSVAIKPIRKFTFLCIVYVFLDRWYINGEEATPRMLVKYPTITLPQGLYSSVLGLRSEHIFGIIVIFTFSWNVILVTSSVLELEWVSSAAFQGWRENGES